MTAKRFLVFSLILNLLTIAALSYLTSHYNLVSKVLSRILPDSEISYRDNYRYEQQTGLYGVYRKKKAAIVMLGDSITYGVNWNELLNRDVANRGIGSDTTQGFLNRLTYIYEISPEICFVMGGINDISHSIPVQEIFQNYKGIIEGLKSQGIIPVIQSTLYTSRPTDCEHRNSIVKELNELLYHYANEHRIEFIDLNARLSQGNKLVQEYTYDGVHLNSRGYEMWSEEIESVLKKYGMSEV